MTDLVRSGALPVLLALALILLVGCTEAGGKSGARGATAQPGSAKKAGKIALLLPESKTARYESFDKPLFTAEIAKLCPDCEVVYSNADQDPAKQQQQGETAITQGVSVLVLDAVDGRSAVSLVTEAHSRKIPVLAYDRPIANADFYLSFDNENVGRVQAQALVDRLAATGKRSPRIVAINGSPTDGNAAQFKKGAQSVFAANGVRTVASYDTPDWSPDKAQQWMEGQVSALGGGFDGVYAANDGTAGGAIAAMKGAGLSPLPPVTGQDSELAALQRIVAGDQFMTIYKSYREEAERGAQVAVGMLQGVTPAGDARTDGVPSQLLPVVPVTVAEIADPVISDGLWTLDQICTPDYRAACQRVGLR